MRSAFAGALVPCRDDRPAIWGRRTICPRRVPARRLGGTVRRPHRLPIHLRRRQHLRAARERPGAERSPTRAPRRSSAPDRAGCRAGAGARRPGRDAGCGWPDPTAAPASRPRARPRCSWRPHSGRGVDDSHRAPGPCQHRMAHRPTAEPPSPARVLQRPAAGPTPPARPGPAQPDPDTTLRPGHRGTSPHPSSRSASRARSCCSTAPRSGTDSSRSPCTACGSTPLSRQACTATSSAPLASAAAEQRGHPSVGQPLAGLLGLALSEHRKRSGASRMRGGARSHPSPLTGDAAGVRAPEPMNSTASPGCSSCLRSPHPTRTTRPGPDSSGHAPSAPRRGP